MTSSTDSQSLFSNLSRNACKGIAPRSSVRTCASAPPYRPIGVRMPSQTNAADMRVGFLSRFAGSRTGHVAGLRGPASQDHWTIGLLPEEQFPASGFAFNGNQFDFKDKRVVRSNDVCRAAVAVGQAGWDDDLPFGTNGHEQQGFFHAGDD